MSTPSPPPPVAVSASSSWSSVTIATVIIASAVVTSAAVYILIQRLSKRFRRDFSTADDVVHVVSSPNLQRRHVELLDSLPVFTFRSVTRHLNGGDCAVCLSTFEPHHQLRLLPLCCHAFHAGCIDTWIVTNQTCPLCRSIVRASDCAALDKILSNENGSGGSFRVELGSVSRSRVSAEAAERARRTYSLGSFEYVVDDCVHEVCAASTTHRRGISDNNKDPSNAIPAAEAPAEVRNWLSEYLASISSRTMSFRSFDRCFSGRSEAAVVPEDLEANRAGEESSEASR